MLDWCTIEQAADDFKLTVQKVQEIIANSPPVPTETGEDGTTLYLKSELDVTLSVALDWELATDDLTAAATPGSSLRSDSSGPVRFKSTPENVISVREAAQIYSVTQDDVLKMIAAGGIEHATLKTPAGDEIVLNRSDLGFQLLKRGFKTLTLNLNQRRTQIEKSKTGSQGVSGTTQTGLTVYSFAFIVTAVLLSVVALLGFVSVDGWIKVVLALALVAWLGRVLVKPSGPSRGARVSPRTRRHR